MSLLARWGFVMLAMLATGALLVVGTAAVIGALWLCTHTAWGAWVLGFAFFTFVIALYQHDHA